MNTICYLKGAVIFILQSAFTTMLLAQAPLPKQWDYRFGGTKNDVLNCLDQTMDGGYILGGWSDSEISGDKTESGRGAADYWIVKLNANGTKEWDKRFGGTKNDYLYSLQQTADGGYILGGYSSSGIGGDKTEASRGAQDYWIVKTDVSGNKQWDKRFGGASYDNLNSIRQTADGGFILGGYSYSDAGGDKSEASRGGYDYWIVKVTATGAKQWDKRFGGSFDERLYALQQTSDGGYILGGSSNSNIGGDKSETSRGSEDYWVVKINVNGIKQADKTFGGTSADYLTALQQTTDKGYILGGYSSSGKGSDKTQASRGNNDYWVIKTDAAGNKQWDQRYGGGNVDYLNTLKQTSDGGFIFGGSSFSGISGDKTQASRGDYDFWIVKTDIGGRKDWDARYGGSNGDELHWMLQTADGGFVLGGPSSSPVSGDKSQPKWGNDDPYIYDYWVVKLGCGSGAKIAAVNSNDLCLTNYSAAMIANASQGAKLQWLRNDSIITGANSRFYNATTPGNYRVVSTTESKCAQLSNVVTVINFCNKISYSNVEISPNPSKGNIAVWYNSKQPDKIQLDIYNKAGKLVFSKEEVTVAGKNTYRLNLPNFTSGIYNLQINNGSEQQQVKFVIENN